MNAFNSTGALMAGQLANVSLQNLAKLSQLIVNDDISHLTKPDIYLTEAWGKNLSKPDIRAGICGADQPLGSMPWSFSLWRHASLTQALNWPFPAAVAICSKRSSSNRMFLTVLFERSKLRLVFFSCISSQPLGSMPLDWSSLRSTRFIHVASVVSPSCLATSSNCCLKSSCKRIWYWGERFSLCVDMVITISYILLHGNDHVSFRFHTKQRPAVLATHTGRLTKPLDEVTVMAMNKHTQTRPKYQYRFLAVSRQDWSVPPFRLCIDAGSEQEAQNA